MWRYEFPNMMPDIVQVESCKPHIRTKGYSTQDIIMASVLKTYTLGNCL